ncbi:MAG TPA: hypothetical protein DEQ40_06500, partial [Oxalobacteraceae bacterium]|nr:hypothetical protein [Oxalobacteraceae bacterium]
MAAPLIIAAALTSGCSSMNNEPIGSTQYSPPVSQTSSAQYGVVDSIQTAQAAGGTSGLGAVAGGVVGGVLGNQG